METEMKCEKCGGMMKKMDEHTMKCENCGFTVKTGDHTKEESEKH